jgi:hypothetical protein
MGEIEDCGDIANGRNRGLWGILEMGEMEDCEGYWKWAKWRIVRDIGHGRNRGLWGILEMVEIEDCGGYWKCEK